MADLYVCSHGNTKPCDECQLSVHQPDVHTDDYVAWCCYTYDNNGGIRSIKTCDSDAKGAFKVYRSPVQPEVSKALEELREMFPEGSPSIEVYIWFTPEGYRGAIFKCSATLSEAMAKVREWHAEVSKEQDNAKS